MEEDVAPDKKVQQFNSNEDAVQALRSKAIDVLAVDLPTALYLAGAELDDGVVVGQLESDEGGDQFGLLLAKDFRPDGPVTEAVDALREEGVLDDLADEWLTGDEGAPILQ